MWLTRSLLANVVLITILGLLTLSIVLMIPLKEVDTKLLLLDKRTGELSSAGVVSPAKFTQNWQLTQFLIRQYIVMRESYDIDNLEYPYQMAWAMSNHRVAMQYDKEIRTDNKNSPFQKYGKTAFINVHVLSVNRINPDTVLETRVLLARLARLDKPPVRVAAVCLPR